MFSEDGPCPYKQTPLIKITKTTFGGGHKVGHGVLKATAVKGLGFIKTRLSLHLHLLVYSRSQGSQYRRQQFFGNKNKERFHTDSKHERNTSPVYICIITHNSIESQTDFMTQHNNIIYTYEQKITDINS